MLLCHYCGHTEAPPHECPHCKSTHLRTQGSGTERLEVELKRAFPSVAVARLDRDVAQRPADLHQALHAFRTGKTQILVGTQMVTKGHDFPNVTLVGVVFADAGLNFPDFRAAERTGAAARASRGAIRACGKARARARANVSPDPRRDHGRTNSRLSRLRARRARRTPSDDVAAVRAPTTPPLRR